MRKKTTEKFKEEVYNLVGNDYSVLGEYVNTDTKILMRHNVCKCEYEVRPYDFLKKNGNRCPKCFGNNKKTTEKFKEEVYNLVGDDYEVLGEYKNSETKIEMLHKTCGNKYFVRPNDFLKKNGNRCPKCSNLLRYSIEKFKEEVFKRVGNKYTVLGDYINTDTKIEMLHNECGHKYMVKPYDFLKKNGNRCPKCYGNTKLTTEEFKQEVYDLVGNDYEVLGEYVNSTEKIEMKHNVCKNTFMVRPHNFKSGTRCPYCANQIHYTNETFKQKVYDLVEDEYEVLGDFINVDTKIEMLHKTCGHKYFVRPSDFMKDNGNRCPKCSHTKKYSEAEKEIIEFIKTFYVGRIVENNRSILNGKELDIYLPEKNIAIEFDGLYWHSELNGKDEKYHLQKTIVCKSKGINLIHIFEDEWFYKKEIVQEKLKQLLGYYPDKKISLSKYFVKEISNSDKGEFLTENSLYDNIESDLNLGLWYCINEELGMHVLVALMTFNDHTMTSFTTHLKFYFEDSFKVLFDYFKENYEWNSIDVFIDRKWNLDQDYKDNGFVLEEVIEPKCFYINKHNLLESSTDDKFFSDKNYTKIWDCGQLHYTYER